MRGAADDENVNKACFTQQMVDTMVAEVQVPPMEE